MPERPLIMLGAGGHAAVVAESAKLSGWSIVGFLDDREDARLPLDGIPHLGRLGEPGDDIPETVRQHLEAGGLIHAAAGAPELRRRWLDCIPNGEPATIVHPSAVVSSSATIGTGCFIGPNAVVNARTIVGSGVIVNSGAVVEHDVTIGNFAHIAPGSVVAGEAGIGSDTLLGAGSVVLPKIRIGDRSVLAAGGVASRNIPDDTTSFGGQPNA